MKDFENILVLIGTVLPLIGTGLTIIFASISSGITRWVFLSVLPILTMIICWLIIDLVWKDGNMLAASLYLVYVVALFIYYPILAIIGLFIYRDSRNDPNKGSSAS